MDSVVESHPDLATRDECASPRGFTIAVVVSLLLHLLLIIAITRLRPLPAPPSLSAPKAATVVTLRQYRPRNPSVPQDAGSAVLAPGLQSALPGSLSPRPKASAIASAPRSVVPNAPDGKSNNNVTDDVATTPVIDESQLAQSIANYMTTYRNEQKSAWAAPCVRSRNPYVKDDCPPGPTDDSVQQAEIQKSTAALFNSYVTGHQKNERATKALLARMDAMRTLMTANPAMARIASENYSLAEQQYFFLTGTSKNMKFIMSVEERAAADSIMLVGVNIGAGGISVNIPLISALAKAAGLQEKQAVMAKPFSPEQLLERPSTTKATSDFTLRPAALGAAQRGKSKQQD